MLGQMRANVKDVPNLIKNRIRSHSRVKEDSFYNTIDIAIDRNPHFSTRKPTLPFSNTPYYTKTASAAEHLFVIADRSPHDTIRRKDRSSRSTTKGGGRH